MGDDGSHRLLVVPCALVVLVLVLMVTACSSAGGDPGQGEGASVTGSQAGGADAGGTESVAPGRGNVAQGVIAEPVVAEDGRMLQPEGHTGLWFETEPADPLEKLVYESQRFVGQPVALEPIGDRALLPRWEDMPDPCHPEVFRRMGELGVEVIVDTEVGTGLTLCGFLSDSEGVFSSFGFEFGFVNDRSVYKGFQISPSDYRDGFLTAVPSDLFSSLGCVAILDEAFHGYSAVATSSMAGDEEGCINSMRALQVGVNLTGGNDEFEV
ncbi:hypothetical protein [Corynebacterium kalidii]